MTDMIFPHQLATALRDAPADVAMLSLDCFDTLLWRNVHAPVDVFDDLGTSGPTRHQRIWAESRARSRADLRDGRNEANIGEIYKALLPAASPDGRALLAAAELAAEARHCFAFAPTVALMRDAKSRGLCVAVVSDTYLDRTQLAQLIRDSAGSDVLAMIDHIICSSEHGISKSEGLFAHLLRETKANPAEILHIGDNKAADLVAARAAGLHALHLVQFGETCRQRLRLEAAAGAIVATGIVPSFQPHRAPIALAVPTLDCPAQALGYTTLGPLLDGFSRWIADEASALAQPGSRTHLLFLMRDGYLPKRMFDALQAAASPATATSAIELSRFTATAASFASEEDVLVHLEAEVESSDLDAIARQLLFTSGESAVLLKDLPCQMKSRAFVGAVRKPINMAKILARSQAFRERLIEYLRREVAPDPGDVLMLVDLGYNGTVQDRVEPLLRQTFAARVAGRYLLLHEQQMGGCDKKGLIDSRHYAPVTLDALCANVAVVEQLCTAAQGSVVDYRGGVPVRSGNSIKARQSEVREAVQLGCLRFAADRDEAFLRLPASDTSDTRRHAAAAILARLLFLPMPGELEVLAAFEHDINLGVDGTVGLFDPETAERELRRRGLFYLKGADRMYLPAELRGQGLALSLALLVQRRFGFDLKYADFCDQAIDLPIIIADGHDVTVDIAKAHPTHDGYYMAAIPIGRFRFAIGVQFGRLYDWVQVESAQFLPVSAFLTDKPGLMVPPSDATVSLEGMEQVAPHLLRCDEEAGFMMVPPPSGNDPVETMLTVVFRPIAKRIAPPQQPDHVITANLTESAS